MNSFILNDINFYKLVGRGKNHQCFLEYENITASKKNLFFHTATKTFCVKQLHPWFDQQQHFGLLLNNIKTVGKFIIMPAFTQ